MKPDNKVILTISVLIILTGVICFGMKERTLALEKPAEKAIHGTNVNSDISNLLETLNIQKPVSTIQSPDFELMSIHGKRLSLSGYRDKVVLLSFWATW